MSTLETAIEIAAAAHAGQRDLGGQPYILHPLRVMLSVEGDEIRKAAVLHDVVEDTEITLEDLRTAGFSPYVVSLVDYLSRRKGESYDAFIDRCCMDAGARTIKMADIRDNMNLDRLAVVVRRGRWDVERVSRYVAALDKLRAYEEE